MQSLIAIVVIFGLLVSIHELGHLLLAKRAGILCREFAIGFGPKVFSVKKGETVYTVRLLPLGGFVRMAGEDPEMIEIKPGTRVGLLFDQHDLVEKIIVNGKSEYPEATVVTVEEADLEHHLVIKGYSGEDEPLERFPLNRECLYLTDGDAYQIAPYDRQFGSKSLLDRFLAIFAGPFMNFLLAFVILFIFAISFGAPVNQAYIGGVAEDLPAQEAGLEAGDLVVAINGTKTPTWDSFTTIVQQYPNESLTFTIERDGERFDTEVTPTERENYKGDQEGFIGVGPKYGKTFTGAVKFGFNETVRYTTMIFYGLGQLVTGQLSLDSLSGPVGIYDYTDKAASQGLGVLMQWAAILSVNLGIINLIPLPALDGGRLMFLLFEGIRGKPVDPQKEGLVHFIGFAFLMLLMIVVTWNDIQRLISGN